MREIRQSGSVRGAMSDHGSYRDSRFAGLASFERRQRLPIGRQLVIDDVEDDTALEVLTLMVMGAVVLRRPASMAPERLAVAASSRDPSGPARSLADSRIARRCGA